MKVFSFSRLSLYDTCPHRFYLKYVEGYNEPLTYPLALGSGVHKAIECEINGMNFKDAVVNGIIEAEFHPSVTERELTSLLKRAPIRGQNRVQGDTEIHFKLPLSDEVNSPMIQGFIDVVGDGYIVDWKTNRIIYDVRKNHQVAIYSWAINQLKGLNEIYGSLYFLRFKHNSKYLFTIKEMEAARLWAYKNAREIQGKLALVTAIPELKDDLFPATPSSFCSHCPFAAECFRRFSPFAVEAN